MLLLTAFLNPALACAPSNIAYVDEIEAGPCLVADEITNGPSTFSVTSSCGPGRLDGPTGAETCDGCAVAVDVDGTTGVTLDLSTLPAEGAELIYTFTPDEGTPEDLVLSVRGADYNPCPEDGACGGCGHTGPAPSLGLVAALGLIGIGRRSVRSTPMDEPYSGSCSATHSR